MRVDGQSIRSRLSVVCDVRTGVAALLSEDGELPVRGVLIDPVVVGVTEEQVVAIADPNRPFGELKAFSKFDNLSVWRNYLIDCRIGASNLDIHFAGSDRVWLGRITAIELQFGLAHPDEVCRRIGNRAVDAEYGKLNLLAGLKFAPDHQSIRRVPT